MWRASHSARVNDVLTSLGLTHMRCSRTSLTSGYRVVLVSISDMEGPVMPASHRYCSYKVGRRAPNGTSHVHTQ
jgi:hypothetical protein